WAPRRSTLASDSHTEPDHAPSGSADRHRTCRTYRYASEPGKGTRRPPATASRSDDGRASSGAEALANFCIVISHVKPHADIDARPVACGQRRATFTR